MSAVREYYDYHTHTLCGLPEIRLLGNIEDYQRLRESAERLAENFQVHLGPYFTNLIPVLKELEQQALGREIDKQFWSSLYKFSSESGTDSFNGWISAFINYIQTAPQKARDERPAKPGIIRVKDASVFDWKKEPNFQNRGIDLGSVPAQISFAPFTWHYLGKQHLMNFVGGVLGIDDVDGYATPALSFAVVNVD